MIKKLLSALALVLCFSNYSSAQCTATISGNYVVCYGDTGVLHATPGGVSYQWCSNTIPIPGATDSIYVITVFGNITAIVDFGGCIDTSNILPSVADPQFYIGGTNNNNPVCAGDTLHLSAYVMGGTPPYTWILTGPNNYFCNLCLTPYITNSTTANSGHYIMQATDGVGCYATDTIIALVNPLPSAPIVTNPVYCLNEIATLTATGTNLLWYITQTGGTGVPTMAANTSSPGIISYYVSQSANGCESPRAQLDATTVLCDSVWPGDVNYDLTADNNDVLDLALAYGQTGTVRTGATNNWVAEYSVDWGTLQTNGIDMKHADCNGDGTVDANDTTAISLNYGLTHLKGVHIPQAKSSADPDLYFDLTGINFTAGTTVSVPIKLGTTAMPMNNILGIAANIHVGGITLATAPVITANTSWMGTNANLLNFTKAVNTNQTDWTLARTDHSNVSGDGTIATLTMDIPSGSAGQDAILYFDDVKIIDNAGNVITNVNILDDTASITPVTVKGVVANIQYAAVVPNPSGTNAVLQVSLAKALAIEITINDVTGRNIWNSRQTAKNAHSIGLPANDIAPGMYTIQIRDEQGAVAKSLKWIRK